MRHKNTRTSSLATPGTSACSFFKELAQRFYELSGHIRFGQPALQHRDRGQEIVASGSQISGENKVTFCYCTSPWGGAIVKHHRPRTARDARAYLIGLGRPKDGLVGSSLLASYGRWPTRLQAAARNGFPCRSSISIDCQMLYPRLGDAASTASGKRYVNASITRSIAVARFSPFPPLEI